MHDGWRDAIRPLLIMTVCRRPWLSLVCQGGWTWSPARQPFPVSASHQTAHVMAGSEVQRKTVEALQSTELATAASRWPPTWPPRFICSLEWINHETSVFLVNMTTVQQQSQGAAFPPCIFHHFLGGLGNLISSFRCFFDYLLNYLSLLPVKVG